ncbi:MAG TPA: exosortase system-associated protein, TIGR04073 family [Myxococcota bacterium]|nr:exosortase system-associated protein, TIGR04073 family [Myxococcota bacterium]
MRGSKLVSTLALLALVGAMVVPSSAQAQTAKAKLQRGFTNLVLGILEVPGTIKQEANATNPVQGLTVGLIKGVFRGARREVVGAFEFLTFPAEIPDDYAPIVEPERPWEYFDY